jgi:hypothetical protein
VPTGYKMISPSAEPAPEQQLLPVPGILGVVGALLAVCLDEALDEFVDIARLG